MREFIKRIGVAKANSVVDVGMLEFCIREELNRTGAAPHGGAAAAQGRDRELSGRPGRGDSRRSTIPTIPEAGTRKIAFGRELYIERDDFMENPPKKFFRLSPGNEVRLRYAYFIKCTRRDQERRRRGGRAARDLRSRDQGRQRARRPQGEGDNALAAGGARRSRRRSASTTSCSPTRARTPPNFAADLNPQSLEVLGDARVEPAIAESNSPDAMQFERQGYFVRDADSTPDRLVFNRTIGLRDTFAKEVGGKG